MITFKSIEIHNFMSINYIFFNFKYGLYNIIGENGVGKTSILMAISQCLFNKNIKTDTEAIATTYNKITNKPYHIIICFEKNGINYKIDNNRENNTINIYENDVNISPKGIKKQIELIEKIIDMDYKLFNSFYYLSSITLLNIFDITNKSNIINKFFDIEQSDTIKKIVNSMISEIKSELNVLSINIKSIEKQISLLNSFKPVDINKIKNEKSILLEILNNIYESNNYKKISLIENRIKELLDDKNSIDKLIVKYNSKKSIITKQINDFNTGLCPVCKQSVTELKHNLGDELNSINESIKDANNDLIDITKNIEIFNTKLKELKKEIFEKIDDIKNKINKLETQIIMYNSNKEKYSSILNNKKDLLKQKDNILSIYSTKKDTLLFLEEIAIIIKNKIVLKEYLKMFIILFNNKLEEIISFVELNLSIIAYEDKGNLSFKFIYEDIEKDLNSLSSGEKTRVGIIVLFSIIETINTLINNKISILALDEILGVLDKKGIKVLKKILNRYKKEMTIFLIQHHEEINNDFFDYNIKVKKIDNLTNFNMEENK